MNLDYFEIVLLTLIDSGSIFLIVVLLANSLNDRLYRWLAIMTISLIVWVNFAYLGFIEQDTSLALTFYKINGASVCLFFYAEYIFYFESFLQINKRRIKELVFGLSLAFGLLILFSDTIIKEVISQEWGNEIRFGPLNDAFGAYALIINLTLIILLIKRYLRLKKTEKKKTLFFLIGTFLFIALNIIFNVMSPTLLDTARYQHFGDYSAALFLIFTAYAILRHKFMNVKIALTAMLIGVMSMLIIIDIFALSRNFTEKGIKLSLLILFAMLAVFLIRSVLNEIKQKEATQRALIQVRESQRRERDMIDIMGHELRTPMSIIRNALAFMDMQLKTNGEITTEKVRKYVDMGLESARRESNLIETMLSATKADAKGFDLTFEKVDLNDVIEDSLVGYRRMAINKGLSISFERATDYNFVYCDRTRVQEISDNFVSNAVKYTLEGSIKIYIKKKEGMIWVTVEDTGIGIERSELKLLGKKFFRARQHLQDDKKEEGVVRPGGTGLGLYVSFALCKVMDGDYKVESKLNHGSKFSFGMPLYINQETKSVQRKMEDYLNSSKGSID